VKKAAENYLTAMINPKVPEMPIITQGTDAPAYPPMKPEPFPFFIDPKTGSGMYNGCSWANAAYAALGNLLVM